MNQDEIDDLVWDIRVCKEKLDATVHKEVAAHYKDLENSIMVAIEPLIDEIANNRALGLKAARAASKYAIVGKQIHQELHERIKYLERQIEKITR